MVVVWCVGGCVRVVVQVVIAQERMSNNDVYCFKKRQPHKFQWVCETRSSIERGMKSSSTMYLQVGRTTHTHTHHTPQRHTASCAVHSPPPRHTSI